MDCVHLSDAELLRLVREGGAPSSPALQELEQRHFPAVRTFAAVSAGHPPAAGELARQSWEAALHQLVDGGAGGARGAVRPWALSSVLRTASGWARGNHRVVLNPQLVAFIDATSPAMPGNTAAVGLRSSPAARAFAGISYRSQTILWHQAVERDDSALTGRLIGAGPGEVSVFTGRAQGELYSSYVQVLRDGMQDECRYYEQLVLAYADTRSANIAVEVSPHLERCARCSRAVADLGLVRHDCGALLAQALLPWGAPEYVTRGTDERVPLEIAPPETGAGGIAGAAAAGGLPVDGWSPEGMMAASRETGIQGIGGQAAGGGRHAAFAAAGTGARRASGTAARKKGRRRADLVVRCTAVAGVVVVGAAFAFGFAGNSSTGKESLSKEEAPSAKALTSPTKTPGPARTTATAKSTSRPTTSKPSKTKSAPPKPDTPRPSSPGVGNASVEWLFNKVDGDGVTPDSSDNNKDGTLFGASRPRPTSGGALAFDGQQFVASSGPLVDTSRSFSVSAQVKLDRTDTSQTVVSQDSSGASAFMLQYDADESQWEMRIPEDDADTADSDADEAVSRSGAVAGEPTHLTGVYDDAADEVRLYVDGRLADTADREDDFASTGSFVVGRGLSGNEFFQGVDGSIDDVQAFGRALSSAEVRAVARES